MYCIVYTVTVGREVDECDDGVWHLEWDVRGVEISEPFDSEGKALDALRDRYMAPWHALGFVNDKPEYLRSRNRRSVGFEIVGVRKEEATAREMQPHRIKTT